jgi:hypothetical protein
MQSVVSGLRRQLARYGLTQTVQLSKLIFDATVHTRKQGGRFNLNSWTLNKYGIKTSPHVIRDKLEKAGFAVRYLNSGPECWDMEPCIELLKYINRYKMSISGRVSTVEAKLAQLETVIRNMIDKFDHPYSEEKYEQYTRELFK